MKITAAGMGYVGLSNAVLLAQHNEVVALEIDAARVAMINGRHSPIDDPELQEFLWTRDLGLVATTDPASAIPESDIVLIATPTNYDELSNSFNTSSVEAIIALARQHVPDATIVIKSTIPVGFVDRMRSTHRTDRILFSPEFLREGRALRDNLDPSRIVVGDRGPCGESFAALMLGGAERKDIPVLLTGAREAEAIKLFSNTYLAMQVAFFNELDSYAMIHESASREIVEGVCLDPRIGAGYNNPSFGYGGYCLPKDTKQLLANYREVPQNLVGAVIDSNRTRKSAGARAILDRNPKMVGIYRLVMKAGSDNFRESSIQDIIALLSDAGISCVIYEPECADRHFHGIPVQASLGEFKQSCDIIVANRRSSELADVATKVFTRDLFGMD